MKNFSFNHNGQILWYSRSLACGCIVFGYNKNNEICVLANKRGDGCEFNNFMWNVPGGFIDFNESAEEAAVRELYEETGVKIPSDEVTLVVLDTAPTGARQTMTASFAHRLPDNIDVENIKTTAEHSEPGEVAEIKFIPIKDLDKYQWTRGQIKKIKAALHLMYDY
jgi:ADP-ribose pyrophosphatase YjhB (NUDIX family)